MRRARLQHWLGDETEAVKSAALAEIEARLEPYLEEMGYRFFLGEARLIGGVDSFPGGYPNQYQDVARSRRTARPSSSRPRIAMCVMRMVRVVVVDRGPLQFSAEVVFDTSHVPANVAR
jgi:hypothetical protein